MLGLKRQPCATVGVVRSRHVGADVRAHSRETTPRSHTCETTPGSRPSRGEPR